MSKKITFDLSENGKNDLLKQISCIKNPIWYEEHDNFYADCLVRICLEKCSGDKVIEMLKTVLSAKERMSLVQNEYESFFQNQAKAFENHVMIKNELIASNDCKKETEPLSEDETHSLRKFETDLPNSFNLVLNENNKPIEENLQNKNVARNSDIANTKATENSAIKRLMTNSNLSVSIQSGEDTIEDIDAKTEGCLEFSLPYGWKKVGCKRKSGVSKDQWDFHVLSPQGKKLRSNNDIFKYLEANPDVKCDQSVTNTSRKPEVLGNLPTLSDLITKNFISSEKHPLNKSSGTNSEGTTLENHETKNSEASFTYKCMSPEKTMVKIEQNDLGEDTIEDIDVQTEGYLEFSLPYGWKKVGCKRKSGVSKDQWDFHVLSPQGKKLRSNNDIFKYLEANPDVKCDQSVTNTSRKPEVLDNLPTLSDLITKNHPLNKSSGTNSEGTTLKNQETKNSEASFAYKCMSPEKETVNKGQNDSGDSKIMLIQEKDDYREYSLPFGWQKIGRRRLNQKDWDFYIISPEGKRFRSTIGVNKYLDINPEVKCDRDVANTQLPSDLQISRK